MADACCGRALVAADLKQRLPLSRTEYSIDASTQQIRVSGGKIVDLELGSLATPLSVSRGSIISMTVSAQSGAFGLGYQTSGSLSPIWWFRNVEGDTEASLCYYQAGELSCGTPFLVGGLPGSNFYLELFGQLSGEDLVMDVAVRRVENSTPYYFTARIPLAFFPDLTPPFFVTNSAQDVVVSDLQIPTLQLTTC